MIVMEMKRTGKIHYLEPGLLTAGGVAVAGFTTRHEGVSRPPYNSLNLGMNTLDSPHNVQGNRSLFVRTFGIRQEKLVTVNQVHGTDLLVLDEPNPDYGHFLRLECDGIITNQPGVMLGVGVADCVPLLLVAPDQRVVAALHAGWKGTAGGIAGKGVATMTKLFGAHPQEIRAAVGPAIGPCCYEVDEPVRAAFRLSGHGWDEFTVARAGGGWGLDLAIANRQQLLDAGLLPANIETADRCVCCQHDWFFSYRRDGGETGRQLGFVMLSP
jgi:purine-nucleoside/S-methyl-5'-thioadenosine phosphorylase / adenosine deaminase